MTSKRISHHCMGIAYAQLAAPILALNVPEFASGRIESRPNSRACIVIKQHFNLLIVGFDGSTNEPDA